MYFYGFFQTDVLINFGPNKTRARQYNRGIPPFRDDTFHM